MKHYKDPITNEVYAYEADGSQDEFIKPGLVQITVDEADTLRQAESLVALSAMTYVEKRAAEYPDYRDYLDGVVKGDQAQMQAYIDACLAVKAKYPKE
jgi:hypothetical protein